MTDMSVIRKMSPGRFIVLGFAFVILLGATLLVLPASHNEGIDVSFIDALFTSTSAVCVTGLITVDTADTYNAFGQLVIALLIQTGGLGFASIGVGVMVIARKKVSFKDRLIIKEALNLDSMKGIVRMVKAILIITLCFEGTGAILSFIAFSKEYPVLKALGISLFHAVSAFNNAGFDILGGFKSLLDYKDNVLINLVTCGLIIFGGLGFIVIKEIISKHSFKKLSLHSKVVITMTLALLAFGTVILKLTEDISWLGAFFYSTSSRTAGFASFPLSGFTNAGLFTVIILMFIGASPGSTGGGIKTTTTYTLIKSTYSVVTNQHCNTFKRKIPAEVIKKAFIIVFLASLVVYLDTFLISMMQPQFTFIQVLFEVVSAFGTVGLSTGITPDLSVFSKALIILTMFIGRLGPLTIATIWSYKPLSSVSYSEETLTIG